MPERASEPLFTTPLRAEDVNAIAAIVQKRSLGFQPLSRRHRIAVEILEYLDSQR